MHGTNVKDIVLFPCIICKIIRDFSCRKPRKMRTDEIRGHVIIAGSELTTFLSYS